MAYYTVVEAAEFLGIARRTMNMHVDRGYIAPDLQKPMRFSEDNLLSFGERLEARREIGDLVKELYVMRECGVEDRDIERELRNRGHGYQMKTVEDAVALYRQERRQDLASYPLENPEDALFVEEVLGRLRATDLHVVYNLVEEGQLVAYQHQLGGKKKMFISKESFQNFLGEKGCELFYNSREVRDVLDEGLTIQQLDRIALNHGLGIKLRPGHKNSTYLFTLADIDEMYEIIHDSPRLNGQR